MFRTFRVRGLEIKLWLQGGQEIDTESKGERMAPMR